MRKAFQCNGQPRGKLRCFIETHLPDTKVGFPISEISFVTSREVFFGCVGFGHPIGPLRGPEWQPQGSLEKTQKSYWKMGRWIFLKAD